MIAPRIDVIRDAVGIAGYAVTGIEQGDLPYQQINSVVLRPTPGYTTAPHYWCVMQMIPRQGFKRSVEYGIARDYCNSRWGPKQERREYFGRLSFSIRLVNSAVKRALAEADPVALAAARRFSLPYRHKIYMACTALGPRLLQLAETFPLALFELFRAGDRTSEARNAILAGRKLREVAAALDIPFAARHLPPSVAGHLDAAALRKLPASVLHAAPRAPRAARQWARIVSWAQQRGWDTTDFICWVTSRWPELMPLGCNPILSLADWARDTTQSRDLWRLRSVAEREGIDLGAVLAGFTFPGFTDRLAQLEATVSVKPFSPLMHTRAALAASSDWHRRVTLMRVSESRMLPRPQLDGAQIGEYSIVPLTTTGELVAEGAAMAHCVATYADAALNGDSCIYSVRACNERVATLELRQKRFGNHFVPYIAQLAGPHNATPAKEVSLVARKWLAAQKHSILEVRHNAAAQHLVTADDFDAEIPF